MEHARNINLEMREDESTEQIGDVTMVEINETEEAIFEGLDNLDYGLWSSTFPFLYDSVVSHVTEWPSLTVEWLPDRVEPYDRDYLVQKIIIGTHTAEDEPNYLMLAQVMLPLFQYSSGGKVEIIQKIRHDGEVNRARCMPQNYFIIATKTISSEVHVFDYRNHPSMPPVGGTCSPDLRLRGHNGDGFGLSWSNFKQGLLLSGSYDSKICLWDINGTPKNNALDTMQVFKVNDDPIEDVAWNPRHECLFGSCGNDRNLHIWDIRSSCVTVPVQSLIAHESQINCLAFNPFNEWIVATGSTDETLKLFDLRKFTDVLYTLVGRNHRGAVNQIGWSPQNQKVLASAGNGNGVMVWDLGRINQRQRELEADGGPPELLFTHFGHTDSVVDLSWNATEDWTVASVANDNVLQIWKLADHIYNDIIIDPEPPEKAKGG